MQKIVNHPISFYTFDHLSTFSEIRHFVSSGAYSIGFSELYSQQEICRNRQMLAHAIGFDLDKMVTAQQVHGTHVAIINTEDAGRGACSRESRIPETDALVTDCCNICLTVLSADCVPVLFYDPTKHVAAAAHSGWKGTAARIVQETVGTMQSTFGCQPKDIIVGIGPSIGPCCFEVSEDVAEIFTDLYPETVTPGKRTGKFQVDLWKCIRLELLDCGLEDEHIETAGLCSVCHPDHFHSYRRDHEKAGRFGAGIMLIQKK